VCVCVCACVRSCARARVRPSVCICVHVRGAQASMTVGGHVGRWLCGYGMRAGPPRDANGRVGPALAGLGMGRGGQGGGRGGGGRGITSVHIPKVFASVARVVCAGVVCEHRRAGVVCEHRRVSFAWG